MEKWSAQLRAVRMEETVLGWAVAGMSLQLYSSLCKGLCKWLGPCHTTNHHSHMFGIWRGGGGSLWETGRIQAEAKGSSSEDS